MYGHPAIHKRCLANKYYTFNLPGGLSGGGKIGIGVGIGVGGTLVLVGILLSIVLCRKYEWMKRKPTGRPTCTCISRIVHYLHIAARPIVYVGY